MKGTFILILMLTMTGMAGYAQKAVSSSVAKATDEPIELKELHFDFGTIPQGRPVTHNFELINKGKSPLLLDNVQASCGCTSPEWSQAPIAAGASSMIKVGFNAAAEGHFSKTITISYNGNHTKTLVISGNVYPTPTTSAPLNSSLSFIKQINQ